MRDDLMFWRRGGVMSACLAVAAIFGLEAVCKVANESPDCARYESAFNREGTVEALENWHRRLPERPDTEKLSANRHLGFGYGRYVMPLDFDPAAIGLNDGAHAELDVDEAGKIREVVVTDVRRVMYVFRASYDDETFKFLTRDSARTDTVGVSCLTPD